MPEIIQGIGDITEPDPFVLTEGYENPFDDPRFRETLKYLVSRYEPEFYNASVWKMRSAALERAKIVAEHHVVYTSLDQLKDAVINDLEHYVTWRPQTAGRRRAAPRPSDNAQRNL